ncbi:cytochrome c oxidase subunit 4 isoform 1, mitochondrial-like [Anthonomus grandis grandis]|uniref:cytochrome c oxidase subunit 4 isoform 1, mitochondrial-like n=1 Tax=Anthonomus grandis grandis TaxID=2921223 RepID=UPI00216650EA|nr:cytochrome c oxidase subunit 4 isoform 1, mitochondrial-like [Anthonomus grandis grandis]
MVEMNFLRPARSIMRVFTRKMGYGIENRDPYWLERIGTRDWVGHGCNSLPIYADQMAFPFPAIRWKETTPELQGLYEKSKGDWRLLTKEEKKTLYRANFCQTFAEMKALNGDFAEPMGHALLLCSAGMLIFIYLQLFVYEELPESFSPSSQRAQLRRQIDLHMNPVRGLSSYWDYDKMDWKSEYRSWRTPPNPFVKCDDD